MLAVMTGSQGALAMPSGGEIAAGQGSITRNGSNMTVNQASSKLSLNWQSFSIAQGEKVQFNQPSASAVALNRVLSNEQSRIFGQLSANGQVFWSTKTVFYLAKQRGLM